MTPIRLNQFASNQWAIVSECGGLLYTVRRTKRHAIADFMRIVNADPSRRHLKWNCKELKYAKAVKVKVTLDER